MRVIHKSLRLVRHGSRIPDVIELEYLQNSIDITLTINSNQKPHKLTHPVNDRHKRIDGLLAEPNRLWLPTKEVVPLYVQRGAFVRQRHQNRRLAGEIPHVMDGVLGRIGPDVDHGHIGPVRGAHVIRAVRVQPGGQLGKRSTKPC